MAALQSAHRLTKILGCAGMAVACVDHVHQYTALPARALPRRHVAKEVIHLEASFGRPVHLAEGELLEDRRLFAGGVLS
jgi:hypothetical protein